MFSFTFPDQDHYEAEFLYRNPGVCYWETQQVDVNGALVDCVVPIDVPTPPNNCVTLPGPSGGDDTSTLQTIINNNTGATLCGNGGTYKLSGSNGLTHNGPITIYNMPTVPANGTLGIFHRIRSADVKLIDCPQDAQNVGSVYRGVDALDSPRFHLIRSGFQNMRHTGSRSGGGVYIAGCADFHIACGLYKDILNDQSGTNTCRSNAFWMNGLGSRISDGGYIVNNVVENLHGNGIGAGSAASPEGAAEFLTVQSHSGHGDYVRIFGNRATDAGKRLVKNQQDGGTMALSNFFHWKTNQSVYGNRRRLAVIEIQLGVDDVIARNNRIIIDGNRNWGYVCMTSRRGSDNIHFDNNLVEINNPWNGANFDQRVLSGHDFFGYVQTSNTDSGAEPTNSSYDNNCFYGSGGVNWHYWMGNGFDLNSGPLSTNGNLFSLGDPNSPHQGIELK